MLNAPSNNIFTPQREEKGEQDGNFQLKNLRMKEKVDSEKDRSKDRYPHALQIRNTKHKQTRLEIFKYVRNYMETPENSNNLPVFQEQRKLRALFSYHSMSSLRWI